MHNFLKGLIIGVAAAAPIGPIAILCIRRSITQGFLSGFATGLGAAVADGIYGLVASFGLTAISDFLITHQFWIKFLGSIFLFFIGLKILLTKQLSHTVNIKSKSFVSTMIESTIITLANPLTIISFSSFASLLGFGTEVYTYFQASLMAFGILAGSTIWFFTLSLVLSQFSNRFTSEVLNSINKISGILIISFGLITLASLILKY